jgi:hypothetical protein
MVDTNICIQALYLLGEKPITSLTGSSPNEQICARLYPGARDAVLSWQAWPFATVRQMLAKIGGVAPPSDFTTYYMLPTEPALLRIIDIDLDQRCIDYQREIYVNPSLHTDQQAVIATDATSVVMRYVGRTAGGLWPPLCVDAMALWLAARMAPVISGKASLRATLLGELGFDNAGRVVGGVLGKLRDVAGYEDSPREILMPSTYLDVRNHGAWWSDWTPYHP